MKALMHFKFAHMLKVFNTLNTEIFRHWGCPYAEFFEPREDKDGGGD